MDQNLVVVVLSQSSIEALDLSPIEDLMKGNAQSALDLESRISILVDGYDDAPELPLIPAVRCYFKALRQQSQFPLFFFHEIGITQNLGIWFLCGFDDVDSLSLAGCGYSESGKCPFSFDKREFERRLWQQFFLMNCAYEVCYHELGLAGREEAIRMRTKQIEAYFRKNF